MPEIHAPEMDQDQHSELLQARIENAQQAVDQAQQQLASATDEEERIIWQNRLKQRQAELEQAEAAVAE